VSSITRNTLLQWPCHHRDGKWATALQVRNLLVYQPADFFNVLFVGGLCPTRFRGCPRKVVGWVGYDSFPLSERLIRSRASGERPTESGVFASAVWQCRLIRSRFNWLLYREHHAHIARWTRSVMRSCHVSGCSFVSESMRVTSAHGRMMRCSQLAAFLFNVFKVVSLITNRSRCEPKPYSPLKTAATIHRRSVTAVPSRGRGTIG